MSLTLRARAARAQLALVEFRYDPNQRRDEDGRWADELGDDPDLPEGPTLLKSRSILGHELAAFDDPTGEYLGAPGVGVAVGDDEFHEISDLGNAQLFVPVADVKPLADAVDMLATRNSAPMPQEGPVRLVAEARVGGFHLGTFEDPEWASQVYDRYTVIVPDDEFGGWGAVSANPEPYMKTLIIEGNSKEFTNALKAMGAASKPVAQTLDRKVDKLRLDGRIELAPDEQLAGSAKAADREVTGGTMLLAGIRTPAGPRLRVGVDSFENPRDWNGSGTEHTLVTLDGAGVSRLRTDMDEAIAAGKAHQTAFTKQLDVYETRIEHLRDQISAADDPAELERLQEQIREADRMWDDMPPDPLISAGVVPAFDGSGGLAWELWGSDDGNGSWYVSMAVKPPGAPADWRVADSEVHYYDGTVDFDASDLRSLLRTMDKLMVGAG